MKIRIQGKTEIDVHEGETLLSALGRAGIPVAAPCGGKHRCGKCKVRILEGRVRNALSVEESLELERLSGDKEPGNTEKAPNEVLACASIPETDIHIALVSENAYDGGSYQEITSPAGVQSVAQIDENANSTKVFRAGAALDIGTTTLSARLVDLDSGRELDTYSALNQQRVFGADVMSRISTAREGKTGELFSIINRQTREILTGFKEKFNLSSIETLAVAGNTTMLHLFVNEDPSSMGEIPFKPVFLDEREYSGASLSLPVDKVYLFPSISAFIGGDVVSGLREIGILEAKETVFFIDIGTNGEMALFHQGRLFCASAAAGPALEGAEISCGCGSIRGAINKVEWQDGKIRWATIGGNDPVGICGCGLIDAMALMLEQEVIDETGAFSEDDREEFPIAPGISLINRDVRQYQLAKSAILSAIKIVCKNAEIELEDVKKVYVAGGLGFYIDQKSAIRTGLLPGEFLDRIEVCGNTSLKGAIKSLLDPPSRSQSPMRPSPGGLREYCKEIIRISEVMDLASDPEFMEAFAENMIFP